MAGNPKTSKYYSTPRAERKSRSVELTLSDEARALLLRLAKIRGRSRSKIVEDALARYEPIVLAAVEFAENIMKTSGLEKSTDEVK